MNEGWAIKRIVEDINHLLIILKRFELHHIFREGNGVVDGMVTLGLNVKDLQCWREFKALPNLVRDLVKKEIKHD